MVKFFLTSTLSMLAILAIEFGIDRWIYLQFNLGRPADERAVSASIGSIIGGLFTCLLWILLIWINVYKNQSTWAASIIFILAGFFSFHLVSARAYILFSDPIFISFSNRTSQCPIYRIINCCIGFLDHLGSEA